MEIPLALSCVVPLVPVAFRALTVAVCWPAATLPIGDAKKVEEHRTLIVALAGFSLAGIAIIGTQENKALGLPLFDITVSFLCYVAALAVQGWKAFWWQDALGDALRDAATGALLLFLVRLTSAVSGTLGWQDWQVVVVAVLAGVAWLLDPGFPMLVTARDLWARRESHAKKSDQGEPSVP